MKCVTVRPRNLALVAPSKRGRNGARLALTLAEVLIACLVLSLGLISVLALFPLGAKQMADAVKDERTAQLAEIQERMARIYWRTAYLKMDGTLRPDSEMFQANRFPELQCLDVGGTTTSARGAHLPPIPVTAFTPSYPLYIDPIGYLTLGPVGGTSPSQIFVASLPGFPRQPMSIVASYDNHNDVSSTTQAVTVAGRIRLFGLFDDLTFGQNGAAAVPVQRADTYNCAWVIQRACNSVRHEANLHVVVYQNRSPDIPPVETILRPPPPSTTINVIPGQDSLHVNGVGLPPIRIGGWIVLTFPFHSVGAGANAHSVEPFADFYRIVSTNTVGGTLTIQVTPPIRGHGSNSGAYAAEAAILDGVVEVFDRGTLSPYEAPAG